jgi:hypothetical protein
MLASSQQGLGRWMEIFEDGCVHRMTSFLPLVAGQIV